MGPEGAAICENCNEILDASFLDGADEVTPVEGERTDVGPAPTSRMPDRLRKTQGSRRGGWNPAPGAPAEAEQRRPYLAEPPPPVPTPGDEARKAVSDLTSFFRSLSPADRWTAGATSLLLFALALPWRWTREDEEIIGVISAWPLLLLAPAVLAMVYLRSRKADSALDVRLRLGQVAAAAGAAVFTGGYLWWASQSHGLRGLGRGIAVTVSTPQVGAFLGLACAVAALFASLPLLKSD
ncbi:MAG TPA: hypothetical protein VLW85_20095 [Myxococcales bacterium]|nr:hypothetical protein [Myxococcales bacterium]